MISAEILTRLSKVQVTAAGHEDKPVDSVTQKQDETKNKHEEGMRDKEGSKNSKTVAQLEEDLINKQRELEQTRLELEQMKFDLTKAKERMGLLESENQSLRKKIETFTNKVSELKAQNEQLIIALRESDEKFQAEIKTLNEIHETEIARINDYQDKVEIGANIYIERLKQKHAEEIDKMNHYEDMVELGANIYLDQLEENHTVQVEEVSSKARMMRENFRNKIAEKTTEITRLTAIISDLQEELSKADSNQDKMILTLQEVTMQNTNLLKEREKDITWKPEGCFLPAFNLIDKVSNDTSHNLGFILCSKTGSKNGEKLNT